MRYALALLLVGCAHSTRDVTVLTHTPPEGENGGVAVWLRIETSKRTRVFGEAAKYDRIYYCRELDKGVICTTPKYEWADGSSLTP
jgi:hypothetical protein